MREGEPRDGKKATVTVSVADDDFVQLVGGQLDGTKVWMERKDGKGIPERGTGTDSLSLFSKLKKRMGDGWAK